MLAVPVMKIEGNLDLTHLERTLRTQNLFSDELIIQDIKRFDSMRREVAVVHDPNDTSQMLLGQYFYQLKSLIPRLSPLENEIKFSFTWFDAFVQARKATMTSIYFEMAGVLWNLAAFESIRGAKVDRSTDDGIRLAGKYFQQAAGYFEYLKEQVLPHLQGCILQCLTTDCLNMVKTLMLAQGQLCYYEKAVRDKKRDGNMKSAIVAKLAAQTSTFYTNAAVTSRIGSLGSVLDISWFALADFQAKCFHGAAEYWQALSSKELALSKGSGYGEEVARYNRAEGYVKQAVETGRKYNVLPALISGADGLINIINSNRIQAQKDLSTIYMENIPVEGSLPEVVGVAMVKPLGLPDQNVIIPSNEYLLFKFVLPKQIIDSNQKFYQDLNSLYASIHINAENATNIGRTTLSSVGLPGSLEVAKSENSIPAASWNKILKIQSMGSIERLKSSIMELTTAAKRANQSMLTIEETLTTEENKDNAFFQQYPVYHGNRSTALTQEIRNNLKLLKDAFNNAQINDETITKELIENNNEGHLLLLTKTKEELLQLFPTAASLSSPPPPPSQEVNLLDFDELPPPPKPAMIDNSPASLLGPDGLKLEDKLHDLAELFEIRVREDEKLKLMLNLNIQENVMNTFINNGNIQEIYDRYFTDARNIANEIEIGIRKQEEILTEIIRLNELFTKYKDSNPLVIAKNNFLSLLEDMIQRYFNLHSKATAGLTFYSNLQSKLTTLQQNADDMAYTQQWQRQEYEREQVQEHNRFEQEKRDRELALKLANEIGLAAQQPQPPMATQNFNSNPAPASNSYPSIIGPTGNYLGDSTISTVPHTSQAHHRPLPNPPAVQSTSQGVVYGTPVNGPPTGYQPIPSTQLTSVPNQPSNPPAVNSYQTNPYGGAPGAVPVATATPYAPNPPPNVYAANNNISYASSSAPSAYPGSQPNYNPNAAYSSYPLQPPAAQPVHQPPPQAYPYGQQPTTNPSYPVVQPGMNQPPPQYQYQQPPQQPQQPQQPPRQLTPAEMDSKIARIMEMGFARQDVQNALSRCGWNEEQALSILLGEPQPQAQPPAPAPQSQSQPKQSSGGFFSWSKK